MNEKIKIAISALKSSYSILFFSQNELFGMIILIASFTTLQIGLFGLLSTIVAIITTFYFKHGAEEIKSGELTFNSTLIGFAIGAFFLPNLIAYALIIPFSLLAYFLTIVLKERFARSYLPFLSLPFTFIIWTFMAAHFQIFNGLHPSMKSDPRYFSLVLLGGPVSALDGIFQSLGDFPFLWAYFKSLGFITFNSSVVTGVIISIGLLIHSRVAFTFTLIGAAIGYFTCGYLNASLESLNGISILGNLVFTFLAIGGFFLVSSLRSLIWAFLASMGTFLLYFAILKVIEPLTLPVLFAPFCISSLLFISFIYGVNKRKEIGLPAFQYYSPEKNIYAKISEKINYDKNAGYIFTLPFMGEWFVSQGYDGAHTHIGAWSKALDFIIVDEKMKPYAGDGAFKEDYYAYGKPVLACSDGVVEDIIDGIEDNDIGDENLMHNWGNTIVIRHGEYLYSKISHIQKDSFVVKKGDYVKRGDVVANSGNSGRSPYPHIHFQFQTSALIDSPSLDYSLSFFEKKSASKFDLFRNSNPEEGEIVRNPEESVELKKALKFAPGSKLKVSYDNKGTNKTETWLSVVDQYNKRYIYCEEKKSFAYFTSYDAGFRFHSFTGDNSSILYLFSLALPKVKLLNIDKLQTEEILPMSVTDSSILRIVQDFISPFYIFLKPFATIEYEIEKSSFDMQKVIIKSNIYIKIANLKRLKHTCKIEIIDGSIAAIEITSNKKRIKAICEA